jgi:hypothetical protein
MTSTCFSYARPSTRASVGATAGTPGSRRRTSADRSAGRRSSRMAISRGRTRGRVGRGQTSSGANPARRSSCASQMSIPRANRPVWDAAPAATGTLSSRSSNAVSGAYRGASPASCTHGSSSRASSSTGSNGENASPAAGT